MGISNGCGTIAGMLCPIVVENLTREGVKINKKSRRINQFNIFFKNKDSRRMVACFSNRKFDTFCRCHILRNICFWGKTTMG